MTENKSPEQVLAERQARQAISQQPAVCRSAGSGSRLSGPDVAALVGGRNCRVCRTFLVATRL